MSAASNRIEADAQTNYENEGTRDDPLRTQTYGAELENREEIYITRHRANEYENAGLRRLTRPYSSPYRAALDRGTVRGGARPNDKRRGLSLAFRR